MKLTKILQKNLFPVHLVQNIINHYLTLTRQDCNPPTSVSDTTRTFYFKLPYIGPFSSITQKKVRHFAKRYCNNIDTVQPKNNARARSGARSSCAPRTRKPPQDAKMSCFCGLAARTFETKEVESLTARSRKKLKIQPQEAARTYESNREPQESGRSCCRSHCPFDNIKCCVGGRNALFPCYP